MTTTIDDYSVFFCNNNSKINYCYCVCVYSFFFFSFGYRSSCDGFNSNYNNTKEEKKTNPLKMINSFLILLLKIK